MRALLTFILRHNGSCRLKLGPANEDLHAPQSVYDYGVDMSADGFLEQLYINASGFEMAFEEVGLQTTGCYGQEFPLEFFHAILQKDRRQAARPRGHYSNIATSTASELQPPSATEPADDRKSSVRRGRGYLL